MSHDGCRVLETRAAGDGIRRRRECNVCSSRFTTLEVFHNAGRRDGGHGPPVGVVFTRATMRELRVAVGTVQRLLAMTAPDVGDHDDW